MTFRRPLSFLILTFSLSITQQAWSLDEVDGTDLTPQFSEYFLGPIETQIQSVVSRSACASQNWANRGRAPSGYTRGVAISFARSLCRTKANPVSPLARLLTAPSGSSPKDALAWYQTSLTKLGLRTNVAGADSLRAVYVLGLGLGMRESSGKYCEGWDRSAGSNRPSSAAEAGIFQTSYDSVGANPELRKLYQEFISHPNRCSLDVFKEGAKCSSSSTLGTGAGADFQKFNKACPAFATEYAMVLLRVLRKHFGPINRKEAQVIGSCNEMLKQVQQLVDKNPEQACQEFLRP